jgi:ribonucleoside-diphosphate reductase alpha chain
MGATHAEKSTVQAGKMNSVSSGTAGNFVHAKVDSVLSAGAGMAATLASAAAQDNLLAASPATDIKFCAIDDPGCEACQ